MPSVHLTSLAVLGLVLSSANCSLFNGGPGRAIDNAFVNYLTQQAGYTRLAMPSALESGGSLVFIKTEGDTKTIEWAGDLVSCGVPESVVYGETDVERKRLKDASFPNIKANSVNDFGIGVKIPLMGMGGKFDASSLRKTIATVDASGHEVIRRIAVANFLADPLERRKMMPSCARLLETKKIAVLVDVAYIEKGKFEFYKDDNLTLKATSEDVSKALGLDANASAKLTADGTMTIDKRMYVAYKEAFYVPDSGTLAGGTTTLQDATRDLKAASGGL